MSSGTIVAKRYAKALFAIAEDHGKIAEMEQELKQIVQVYDESDELRKWLQHPSFSLQQKIQLLSSLFKDKVSEQVFHTVCLMVQRKRGALLPALLDYYVEIANRGLGREIATVYSPAALSEEEIQYIVEHFSKIREKSIQIENKVDPSLLGGVKVFIGDRLYDGSLSGKLARLQNMLRVSQAL